MKPTDPRGASASWPLVDRFALAACWLAGLVLCALVAGIVLFMLFKGAQFLRPELLWSRPLADLDQSRTGGFLDPLVGTLLLTVMATLIAAPLGTAIAVWLVEYSRPAWLARSVESGVEIVAGTPSIVLAIFGLIFFTQPVFGFLSFTSQGGGVFGRSFFIASMVMSLIALPLIVGSTREALQTIPRHVREASFALGKTRAATIHRVLLPAARPGIATGTALGMGRIAGDTAIVVILLGGTLQMSPQGEIPGLQWLQGTGSTLTSYVYVNSPAGDGQAPEKAYAAALVLLLMVIGLNFLVDVIARGGRVPAWTR